MGEQFEQNKEAHKMHLNAWLTSLGIPSIDANSYWCSARTNLSQHAVKPVCTRADSTRDNHINILSARECRVNWRGRPMF